MPEGIAAAVGAGRRFGIECQEPVLVQETNNCVVWLRPHAVIAKVGTHLDSAELLLREYEVATALNRIGSPVVAPLAGSTPLHDEDSHVVVTLWPRLGPVEKKVTGEAVGRSLRELHDGLAASHLSLPDYRTLLIKARGAAADDGRMSRLATDDLVLLREVLDVLVLELDQYRAVPRRLHGEPHDGNYITTADGLRWIDFESSCNGPLEWDLAFLPDDAVAVFEDVDPELLALLRILNSARISIWCWAQAGFPEMRWHAQHHLDLVRSAWPRWRARF